MEIETIYIMINEQELYDVDGSEARIVRARRPRTSHRDRESTS